MLASFCGGALEPIPTEEDEAEDTSASIISDLICQGAQLGARTDRTGETALHLAARYARADAAKRLLDAGADTNAQDHSGRTPLHTAVTADAQGVPRPPARCFLNSTQKVGCQDSSLDLSYSKVHALTHNISWHQDATRYSLGSSVFMCHKSFSS